MRAIDARAATIADRRRNKKLARLAMLAAALLVTFGSPAQAAIRIVKATIQNGEVHVEGRQAPIRTAIYWERTKAGQKTNSNGGFAFDTTILPADCVGRLKIGAVQRNVVINNCTPAAFFESGVAKTGQTASLATGDDGHLQQGVAWPAPRFTDNSDGTITDNLTGLIWLKDANCPVISPSNWSDALAAVSNLAAGVCGLGDDSEANDWRLPNRNELQSLLDLGQLSPALPSNHPFANFQASYYWSSTSHEIEPGVFYAWLVNFNDGRVDFGGFGDHVIAVRGGP